MGVILSRFKKKKTTLDILEDLESSIKSAEQAKLYTEERQRRIVGKLILYSVGLYVLAAVAFYFLFFPTSPVDQIFYTVPLLIVPIIVVLLKRLVTWYYQRKLTSNEQKLKEMQEKKKKLLDEVMEKETYKKAKEILEKFAPDQLRKAPQTQKPALPPPLPSADVSMKQIQPSTKLTNTVGAVTPAVGASAMTLSEIRRRSWGLPPAGQVPTSAQINGQNISTGPPGPPMPRPIQPRERSYMDKLVDYLIGDGPNNRYALICKQCESHNGLALKEEFEYCAFRCCYCYYWNPARKQRPQAPKLPGSASLMQQTETSSDSDQDNEEDEEDDESGSENVDDEAQKEPEPDQRELGEPETTSAEKETVMATDTVKATTQGEGEGEGGSKTEEKVENKGTE